MPISIPLKRRSSSRAGFTLLEIMVTLAIVGIVLGAVISQSDRVFDKDLKQASNKISSTIRYLYNKSAMEGLFIKLVFDIEERAYWVEATTDPFVLEKETEVPRFEPKKTEEKKEEVKKEETKEEEKTGETAAGGEDAAKSADQTGGEKTGEVKKLEPKEAVFTQVDSYLLKPTKLPDGVFIKDIQVEHKKLPVEGGKESIYFFPNGYVERAIINFRNEEDDVQYSLKTSPLSGRVSIESRYRRLGED